MIQLAPLFFTKWIVIAVNRIASWFGAGYFLKKGIRYKQRRYWAAALIVSIVMTVGLIIALKKISHHNQVKQETPGTPLSQ
jgi:hypothetical protein